MYYGGEYPQAGPFSQQMKAAGLNVPLMGGDGIYSGEYVKLAGATADGRPRHLGRRADRGARVGQGLRRRVQRGGYADPYEAYGAYAYDAANAIIDALKVSLARRRLRRGRPPGAPSTAMSEVAFDGVTGKVAFDEYGDTTSSVLTVYEVEGGAWKPGRRPRSSSKPRP